MSSRFPHPYMSWSDHGTSKKVQQHDFWSDILFDLLLTVYLTVSRELNFSLFEFVQLQFASSVFISDKLRGDIERELVTEAKSSSFNIPIISNELLQCKQC